MKGVATPETFDWSFFPWYATKFVHSEMRLSQIHYGTCTVTWSSVQRAASRVVSNVKGEWKEKWAVQWWKGGRVDSEVWEVTEGADMILAESVRWHCGCQADEGWGTCG